jgi:acyl CoA:acetate/3-ketoacid CoA transferase beta subunit/acyl CoA:acetate/3-ketoacid CoA transferase alpha subunit
VPRGVERKGKNVNQQTTGKLLSLEEAVKRFVRPNMKLHLAGGIGGPSAAICEILRQYSGSQPDFELIQSTVTGHSTNLIHAGLVKKMTFSACMEISETAHPSQVMQRVYAAGNVATDNHESFLEMNDPFDQEETVGILKAINPHLSIVHGCAADEFGNTVLPVPYGDDIWGSLASLEGVLVTVEKIVSSDIIRKYASLVKISGSMVKAVCLAPLGVHPISLPSPIKDVVEPYETDTEFLEELHDASSDPQRLDHWLNDWVIQCQTQNHYIEKLGTQKIQSLKTSAGGIPSLNKKMEQTFPHTPIEDYTRDDMVLIAAAREIVESVVKSNYKTMLVGAGSWSRAARLAYHELIRRGYDIELITGNGQIGYIPQPGESSTQAVSGVYSANMLTDTITTHGVFVGGKNSRCLSVLGAGQVDKYGNINSSRTSEGDFLVGTGGANDAANANEVILILHQSRKRFVETLPYVTARGDKVSKVISTLGVFRKSPGQAELLLVACIPDPEGTSLEAKIKDIESRCIWRFKRAERIDFLAGPTNDELYMLRNLYN